MIAIPEAPPLRRTIPNSNTRARVGKIVLAGVAILAVIVGGRQLAALLPPFIAWVGELGPWGPVAFIAGYILAEVAFVPGALLTLAGGALFGVVSGTLYVLIGATLGSIAAFLVSRHLARDAFERRMRADPRFAAIDDAISREGRKVVFLLRLSPVFPFTLLNYALGLTRIRLSDYVMASVGMIPGTLLYTYSGKLAGDLAAVASGSTPAKGPGYYIVLGLGLAATVVVTLFVSRIARRALNATTGEAKP